MMFESQIRLSTAAVILSLMLAVCAQGQSVGIKKGPWLVFSGDSSTMKILVQTDSKPDTAPVVSWDKDGAPFANGPHPFKLIQNAPSAAEEWTYEFTLEDLIPGSLIYYRVEVDGVSKNSSFRSAPSSSTQALSFYALGNTHTNAVEYDQVCRAMLRDIAGKPSRKTLLLHAGDRASWGPQSSTWDDVLFNQEQRYPKDLLSQFPLMGCEGTSDSANDIDAKKYRYLFPYEYLDDSGTWHSFDYGPVHFVILDATQHSKFPNTPFDRNSPQYAWLKADLESSKARWKVVVTHTPGFSWARNAENSVVQRELVALFRQHRVAAVISSNRHFYSRCEKDGFLHLNTGGGGAKLENYAGQDPEYLKSSKSAHHFLRFDIDGDTLHGTAIDSTGVVVDRFTTGIPKATIRVGLDDSVQGGDPGYRGNTESVIMAALTTVREKGGRVILGPGKYLLQKGVSIMSSPAPIELVGEPGAKLVLKPAFKTEVRGDYPVTAIRIRLEDVSSLDAGDTIEFVHFGSNQRVIETTRYIASADVPNSTVELTRPIGFQLADNNDVRHLVNAIRIVNSNDVHISGLEIDLQRDLQPFTPFNHTRHCGIYVWGKFRVDSKASKPCSNIVIRDCKISNAHGRGIAFYNVKDSAIIGCQVEKTGHEAIDVDHYSDRVFVYGNFVKNCDYTGIEINDANRCVIENNTITNVTREGIRMWNHVAAAEVNQSNLIFRNKISSTLIEAISIDKNCSNNVVAENRIDGAGKAGIAISGDKNIVLGNFVDNSRESAIRIDQAAHCEVIANTLRNSQLAAESSSNAGLVLKDATAVKVLWNYFEGDQGVVEMGKKGSTTYLDNQIGGQAQLTSFEAGKEGWPQIEDSPGSLNSAGSWNWVRAQERWEFSDWGLYRDSFSNFGTVGQVCASNKADAQFLFRCNDPIELEFDLATTHFYDTKYEKWELIITSRPAAQADGPWQELARFENSASDLNFGQFSKKTIPLNLPPGENVIRFTRKVGHKDGGQTACYVILDNVAIRQRMKAANPLSLAETFADDSMGAFLPIEGAMFAMDGAATTKGSGLHTALLPGREFSNPQVWLAFDHGIPLGSEAGIVIGGSAQPDKAERGFWVAVKRDSLRNSGVVSVYSGHGRGARIATKNIATNLNAKFSLDVVSSAGKTDVFLNDKLVLDDVALSGFGNQGYLWLQHQVTEEAVRLHSVVVLEAQQKMAIGTDQSGGLTLARRLPIRSSKFRWYHQGSKFEWSAKANGIAKQLVGGASTTSPFSRWSLKTFPLDHSQFGANAVHYGTSFQDARWVTQPAGNSSPQHFLKNWNWCHEVFLGTPSP